MRVAIDPNHTTAGAEIAISIRQPTAPGELVSIVLTVRQGGAPHQAAASPIVALDPAPLPAPAPTPPAEAHAAASLSVPGPTSNGPAPQTELERLIDLFARNLEDRRKSAETVTRWRSALKIQARQAGWSTPRDLASPAIEDFLLRRSVDLAWSDSTFKAYTSAWRCFTKWAHKRSHLPTDPMLTMESRRIEDAGPGARAATTEEARALLASTAALERMDKRACPRLAYFAMLFLAGCRGSEPGRLLWSDLRLDDPIPHVVWRAEVQKNRRRAVLALAPELVFMLKRHRATHGGSAGPVFEGTPNPRTFTIDAQRAGITIEDRDGATLSRHSARKWFATTLTVAGTPTRMVDLLMRHNGSVEARYFKPTLEEQAEALAKLPTLGLRFGHETASPQSQSAA